MDWNSEYLLRTSDDDLAGAMVYIIEADQADIFHYISLGVEDGTLSCCTGVCAVHRVTYLLIPYSPNIPLFPAVSTMEPGVSPGLHNDLRRS